MKIQEYNCIKIKAGSPYNGRKRDERKEEMKGVMMIAKGGVTRERCYTRSSLLDDVSNLDSARVQFGCEDIFLEDFWDRIDGHCF
jgi:hypothetical protein